MDTRTCQTSAASPAERQSRGDYHCRPAAVRDRRKRHTMTVGRRRYGFTKPG